MSPREVATVEGDHLVVANEGSERDVVLDRSEAARLHGIVTRWLDPRRNAELQVTPEFLLDELLGLRDKGYQLVGSRVDADTGTLVLELHHDDLASLEPGAPAAEVKPIYEALYGMHGTKCVRLQRVEVTTSKEVQARARLSFPDRPIIDTRDRSFST